MTKIDSAILNPKQHFEILDGLRGVDALSIVLFHFMEIFYQPNKNYLLSIVSVVTTKTKIEYNYKKTNNIKECLTHLLLKIFEEKQNDETNTDFNIALFYSSFEFAK